MIGVPSPPARLVNYTTSARCLCLNFLAGFLGLGRPTALAVLPLRVQLSEVLGTSLGDLPPTLPSKTDGGGIFLLGQTLVEAVQSPDAIMPDTLSLAKRMALVLPLFQPATGREPLIMALPDECFSKPFVRTASF
jgi:hypothetical protein